MRLSEASLLLFSSLSLSGCAVLSSQPTPPRWTTGFWFWNGSSVDPAYSGETLDALFVQVGTIRKETLFGSVRRSATQPERWYVGGALPSELPKALMLRDVVRDAGASNLGRDAARLAVTCLRGINTERFGRQEDIRQAEIDLVRWLRQPPK